MSTSRRPRSRIRHPRLTARAARDPDERWKVIDKFLRSAPAVQALREKLATLLEQVRELGDFGLVEEIEDAGNELRAEMLDQAVTWAFHEGVRAGQERRRREPR